MDFPGEIKDYFAGAVVAFSIVLIVNQVINFIISGWNADTISSMEVLLGLIQLSAHIIGGFLAGNLIAKKLESEHILAGLTTGLLAYLFEAVYISIFGNSFMPEFWALGGFILSGASGAYVVRKKQLESEKDEKK